MSRCADSNCGYYYKKDGEKYPRCHYDEPWPAPCEYDDEPEEEEDDPCIGCPFEGRGSEHCTAVVGDYCRAANEYIEETEEDKKLLKEIKKS